MKLSIKVLSMLALIFAVSFTATAAQQTKKHPRNPEQFAKRHTTKLVKKLSLDHYQAAAVEEINLRSARGLQKARKISNGDRIAMKKARKKINNAKHYEMKQVLTPKQYIAYEHLLAERKAKRKGGKKGKSGERGQRQLR